jgi:hypothetical protein
MQIHFSGKQQKLPAQILCRQFFCFNKEKSILQRQDAFKMSALTYFPGRLPAKYFRH